MSSYTILAKALKPVIKQITKTVAKETIKRTAIIGGSAVGGAAVIGGTAFGVSKAVRKKKEAAALHPVDSDEDEKVESAETATAVVEDKNEATVVETIEQPNVTVVEEPKQQTAEEIKAAAPVQEPEVIRVPMQEFVPNPAFQIMAQMHQQQMMQNAMPIMQNIPPQQPIITPTAPIQEAVEAKAEEKTEAAEDTVSEQPVLTAKDIAEGKKASKKSKKAVSIPKP